jgi:hypothetical protein
VTVVDDIRRQVERRLADLEPLVAEYDQLTRIRQELDASGASNRLAGSSPRRPSERGNGASTRTRAPRTDGPKRGRAGQAIEIIARHPGVRTKEIAAHMGINENYLYRLLPRMEKQGQLTRQDNGWAVV